MLIAGQGPLVIQKLHLLEDQSELLKSSHYRMLQLSQVELPLLVLIFVVSEHVQLSLNVFLALEHADLFISVDEVVEVHRAIHCDRLALTLLFFLIIGFLRHEFPLNLLILVKLLVMIHQLEVLEVERLCELHSLAPVVHNPVQCVGLIVRHE